MSETKIRNTSSEVALKAKAQPSADGHRSSRLNATTAELVKAVHKHLEKRAEQQLLALRRGAARFLKSQADGADASASASASMFELNQSARRQFPRADILAALGTGGRPGPMWSPCLEFATYPPFLDGSPLPPGMEVTAPGSLSVLQFSEANPATGDLNVASVVFNDDPTAIRDSSGYVYKQTMARMIAVADTISPTFSATNINVSAAVQTHGYTIGFGRKSFVHPTGSALVWLKLRLVASVASRGEMVEDAEIAACRSFGTGYFASYTPLETKFDQLIPLSLQLPVAAGDTVVVAVSAELYAGVSIDSDLYVITNFAPLSGLWLPSASMQLQGVIGTC